MISILPDPAVTAVSPAFAATQTTDTAAAMGQELATAIATLLEGQLGDRLSAAIRIKTGWSAGCLGILLEAETVPDRAQCLEVISPWVTDLPTEWVQVIKVFGRSLGDRLPTWHVELQPKPEITPEIPATWPALTDTLKSRSRLAVAPPSSSPLATQPSEPATISINSLAAAPPGTAYLRFQLTCQETALLPLQQIREILSVPIAEIRPVPGLPAWILGLYHCRGEILWIVDLAGQLGLGDSLEKRPQRLTTEPIAVLWVQGRDELGETFGERSLGLAVHQVGDLERYTSDQVRSESAGLFPDRLRRFVEGYVVTDRSLVLSAGGILQDPQLGVQGQ